MNGSDKDDTNLSDKELAERLRRLGDKLGGPAAGKGPGASQPDQTETDPSGIGKAMRLSSEFIAGVIAGGLLGYLVDRVFGSSPFGLITLLFLGFLAGLMNVMRASGMLGPPSGGR